MIATLRRLFWRLLTGNRVQTLCMDCDQFVTLPHRHARAD